MSSILLIGRHDLLTDTHRAILELAGYQVEIALNEPEALAILGRSSFAVVELLFNVPMVERHRIAAAIKRMDPAPQILVLHNSGHGPESRADASLDSRVGPAEILTTLASLIKFPPVASELEVVKKKAKGSSA